MASMNSKWAAAVATLAASLLFGGTAFASPPSGVAGQGRDHTAVVENPIGEAYAVASNAITDVDRRTHQTLGTNPGGLIGEAYAVASNAITDVDRQTR